MKMFSSITHVIFLCVFYCASLCLLRLSWAEDVAPAGEANAGTQEWSKDNFSNMNFSEGLIISVNSVITNSDITNSAVVQSSFEEVPIEDANPFSQAEFAFVDTASQNSGVFNEITDTGQGVVFTLADAATAELQQRADIPSAITSHNETPNLVTENATNEQILNVVNLNSAESQVEPGSDETNDTQQTDDTPPAVVAVEPVVPTINIKENKTETHEDIPSFSEWTQKQLEEAEKRKELVNTSSQSVNVNGKSNSNVKVRSKNYASLDCGAKIVSANPEAVSANSILSPSRDEYKLNTCTNRIWFIVELCEAIQAKKIDLANFELFSSSPKDFSVFVSDRFPSRDWLNVGQFTAKDERDVQSFDLHPHLFGKFIKVEMLSHYGSEHFCPISLFRVYGTSEFEALEKEDEEHGNLAEDEDDDDDEAMDTGSNGEPPKNLLSSATDAVISIVKKAAEVLGNKGNNSNQSTETDRAASIKSTNLKNMCVTPSHLVVCDNCSDTMFGKVYNVISCKTARLYNLIQLELIKNALCDADTCKEFGLDFRKRRMPSRTTSVYSAYVRSFFSPTYLVALCNALAVIEQKVVLNISKQFPNITKEAPSEIKVTFEPPPSKYEEPAQNEVIKPTEKLTLEKIEVSTAILHDASNITDASEIKPTKAYASGNDLNTHPSPEDKVEASSSDVLSLQSQQEANATLHQEVEVDLDLGLENLTEYEVTTESSETLDLDLMSELNNLGSTNIPNTASMSIAVPQAKESVFLRLSNRIKALERNMSLSSQYLEELSRRYKKQVEEMQRLLDKTMNSLNEESRKRDEYNRRLEQQLNELSEIVSALMMEKNSWITTTYWLFLTMVSFFGILTFCRRGESKYSSADDPPTVTIQRRKSIAVVSHNAPQKKERRPSEEALKIRGTYKDLMIDDVDVSKKKYRERKRRKKKASLPSPHRSNSISMLAEEEVESDATTRTTMSDVVLQNKPPWSRQESAPARFPQWDGSDLVKHQIEDIPIVLEEMDNSPLQSLPIPHTLESTAKTNGNVSLKDSPSFMKTLKETRSKRNGSVKINGFEPEDNSGQYSPTPSSGGTSLDDVKSTSTPKKEKKSGIKRIFRKVF